MEIKLGSAIWISRKIISIFLALQLPSACQLSYEISMRQKQCVAQESHKQRASMPITPYKQLSQTAWSNALAFRNRIFRIARIHWDVFFQAKHLCEYIFAYRAYMVLSAAYEKIRMPPEVLFLQFLHALHPVQYYNDCISAFGRLVAVDFDADSNNEEATYEQQIFMK